ncbi:hypothetical protein SELMODRAFT_416688 [Selaginella moellendorffii]|uniref:Uncharacterized protein n=1 Tax=Selaginella moellendorffii TaxID=88036 RepID=D8S037_SELML|nr:hypothetical protein SELMODRAFT_416688 [Selaginella moellendorffii]
MYKLSCASCEFDHPASLETLDCSMDAELKQALVKDLEAFVGAQDYYKRIGKAWKRSYLVHGRQASGKEQLVASSICHLFKHHVRIGACSSQRQELADVDPIHHQLLDQAQEPVILHAQVDLHCRLGHLEATGVHAHVEIDPALAARENGVQNIRHLHLDGRLAIDPTHRHNRPSIHHPSHHRMLSSTHLARVLAELCLCRGDQAALIMARDPTPVFLMNLVSHCFTIYAFYMGAIFWPPEFPEGSRASALVPVFVALFFVALLGRKKSNAYGGTSGFLSGVCSIMSTNQWVMLPLLAISCCGLFTPVLQPAPDRWYDGPGLFKFIVVYMTRGLSYMAACVLGTVAPLLGWHRQALLLLGSIAAIDADLFLPIWIWTSGLLCAKRRPLKL